jgi:hypothetical protein
MEAAEQFANDYLLVIENDQDAWDDAKAIARSYDYNLAKVSDEIRDQWENLVEQLARYTDEKYLGCASLILRQTLSGWGSTPFDLIARHIIERDKENA